MKRVIYADDLRLNRNIFRDNVGDFLREARIEGRIDLVNDGRALVEAVRANNYDLVFTDNSMPVMFGLQAIEAIREFNLQVPIYLFSSRPVNQEVWESAGATGFIERSMGVYGTRLKETVLQHLR